VERSRSDVVYVLNTLGRLWIASIHVDWNGFYSHERREAYPFERKRHLTGNQISEHTIEETAGYYAAQIRTTQSRGPYFNVSVFHNDNPVRALEPLALVVVWASMHISAGTFAPANGSF
jgi:acyl transferase domain-containing protein